MRFGTEQALRKALAVNSELAAYAQEELASIDAGMLARDVVSRQYAAALRRALGLDHMSNEEVEAAHERWMRKVMDELNGKQE